MGGADTQPPPPPPPSSHAITAEWIHGLRAQLAPELQAREWYTILVAATASAHLGAETVPLIYDAAIEAHAPRGDASRDEDAVEIARRVKECLFKGAVIYGIPASLDGALQLVVKLRQDAAHDPGRDDKGFYVRKDVQHFTDSVADRGKAHMRLIYQHNLEEIIERMGTDMEDLKAATIPVNYGWNLSDPRVLDLRSTELVLLAALVAQNLRPETLWHMRGALRVGWSRAAVESVRTVAIAVATFAHARSAGPTDRVPRLDEVRDDTNEL